MSTADDVESAIDFANVTSTELSDANEIRASVAGAGEDGGALEAVSDQELVGPFGLLARPLDDANGERVECVVLRRNDEVVVLALGKDRRVQVAIEKGETIVTNLDSSAPCRVRMLATGEVLIEAGKVGIVAPGDAMATASKALALAERCDDRLSTLRTQVNSHTHQAGSLTNGAGAVTGITGTIVAPMSPLASVASVRAFAKD